MSAGGGRPRWGRPLRAGRRLLAAALALPLLAGCISEEREVALGNQIAANVNARIPLVEDAPLNLYVTDLGRMIAKHSARPDLRYHFYIVDTDGINAFALPGGHIYINRGLIERTRNVSELAGVLAHEIGHVAARHGARNLQRQLRTGGLSGLLWRAVVGRDPLLDQEALKLGGQIWLASHSRHDEAEADRLAVRYLIDTGVDPRGMLTLFTHLLEEEQRYPQMAGDDGWFATHPATAQRLELTRQQIRTVLPEGSGGKLADNNASYPRFLQRLSDLPPPPLVIPMQQQQLRLH